MVCSVISDSRPVPCGERAVVDVAVPPERLGRVEIIWDLQANVADFVVRCFGVEETQQQESTTENNLQQEARLESETQGHH